MEKPIITILGPTASGKTGLATALAARIGGEIISADSRQVYKGMDIGAGKDLDEYRVGETVIPYHLIDIVNPGEKYNLARFQSDFKKAVQDINSRNKPIILCGGTGLYIQSVVQGFEHTIVPENDSLRKEYETYSNDDLGKALNQFGEQFDTRKRAIRFLEIEAFKEGNPDINLESKSEFKFRIFGLNPSLNLRRNRITNRLKQRLVNEGMIDEAKRLLEMGVSYEMLEYYGLEYKYLSYYLKGDLSYEEMFASLETAIHRFAKRQMTFFRSMQKKGIVISWLEDELSLEEKIEFILKKAGF